jgi:tripartite-type tricarboxylate transporter receptor subunit TctC
MKVLASTGRTRAPTLPAVPTLIESGFADFEAIAWLGIMAPAGTPRPIIERHHREMARILAIAEVRERLAAVDFEVISSSSDEFASFIGNEIPRWGQVIKQTGARAN